MRYYYTHERKVKLERLAIPNVGEDVEHLECSLRSW